MTNRNNLPNGHQINDRDDQDGSSDEADQNQTINMVIYIVFTRMIIVKQPTVLGEQATDERVIDPQELTNEEIDEVVQRPVDQPDTTIPALFECIAYQLFTSNTPFRRPSSTSQSLNQHFVPPVDMFDIYRDAAAEGRADHPSDDQMILLGTTQIVEPVPYGIQAIVQTHDMPVLVDPNDIQHTNAMINHENADEIDSPNVQNEPNVRMTINEDNLPQTVVDNPTCNINPVGSTESQDDVHSGDSSDEDLIRSSESAVHRDADSSFNENNQTSLLNQPITVIENPPNTIQNSCRLNQVDEQPITTVPRLQEPAEIKTTLTIQTDIPRQIIVPPAHSRTVNHIPKPINTVHPNSETSDEENT